MAGVDIEMGGFWLGPGAEPSAVDPWLPIDFAYPDWAGHTVGVLRYDQLSSSARAAYLMWLASGRRAPQAPSCWAALYLLGLERRVIHDEDGDPALRAEARALGSVYGRSDPRVFGLAADLDHPPRPQSPPPLPPSPSSIPGELVIELGRRALAGVPVTADWAMAWAWYHPRIVLREAGRHAPEEFVRLWRHHFELRYPDGLQVPPRRRRLVLTYQPVNPTLPRPIERTIGDASDVFDHPAAEQALREITDAVEHELAPFARWTSKNGDEGSVETTAGLLPAALLDDGPSSGSVVGSLIEWAEGELGDGGCAVVSGRDVMSRWTGDDGRAGVLSMTRILERHGIGIEPDARFGGRTVTDDDSAVVLFATGTEPTSTPSASYVLAAVTTEFCMAIASADGSVDDAEVSLLVDRIDRIDDLTPAERLRLAAHRVLVAERSVDLDEVASRAGTLPEPTRRGLAETVVAIAEADGAISADERRVVEAVHRVLGVELEVTRAQADERATPVADAGPVPDTTIDEDTSLTEAGAVPDPGPDGEPVVDPVVLPVPPAEADADGDRAVSVAEPARAVAGAVAVPAPRAVSLDEQRLARTQAANADVRALLGAIFADEEDVDEEIAESAPATGVEATGQRIGSLDVRHSCLLNELADAGSWSRPELERVCARLSVLPDGALDVVNEASFDVVGDPVIELMDDGSVAVDADVLEEMRA